VRIIGGTARGTPLRSLPVRALRPMLDRVRESLFNIIRDVVPGARVLDLFSGTGSLGLEALSRGAATCVFVESDRALAVLIAENARKCRLADRCRVVEADVRDLPRRDAGDADLPADLVFLDPPYATVSDEAGREGLFALLGELRGGWIAGGALLVLHHEPGCDLAWPPDLLRSTDQRVYGRSQLTFFQWATGGGGD